jgi:GntR family transcriptional regulator / MocR family aminotransferase
VDEERSTSKRTTPATYLSKDGRAIQAHQGTPLQLLAYKPFLPGVPALDQFPMDVWSRIVRRTWRSLLGQNLAYGEPAGYFPLRESIAEYLMAHRGVRCQVDQVMIVSGTQQAFDIIARLCLNPGDQVLFENPGYVSARNAFRLRGAEIVSMPVDNQGAMVIDTIRKNPDARMAYITPSHQYPMGVTMTIERRIELIDWAGRSGGLIVEDDYDSEYRFSERPIPAMQGLDRSERTIYVGSFSKVVFPAMSMGYVIVPFPLVTAFENALSLVGRPGSLVDQYILDIFIREGHFGRHLRRMRKVHAARRDALVSSIEKYLPTRLSIVGSQAGLHCAALLNDDLSDQWLSDKLHDEGVIARPLSGYYMPGTPATNRVNGLVLGFACATPQRIASTVRSMIDCW